MTQSVEHAHTTPSSPASDLQSAIRRALAGSEEPLTVSKIRAALPTPHRQVPMEELSEVLRREVAANRLHEYPKYRSSQERYWDRPMQVHLVHLLRSALEEKPMAWPELRRKLPAYAQDQALSVLEMQVQEKRIHLHPRQPGKRTGEPFGIRPADPKDYLRQELSDVFHRLEKLGFRNPDIRAAALDLLHDEEWAPTPPEAKPSKEKSASTNAPEASSHGHHGSHAEGEHTSKHSPS